MAEDRRRRQRAFRQSPAFLQGGRHGDAADPNRQCPAQTAAQAWRQQIGEELHESRIATAVPSEELLAVDEALAALAREDPEAAEVVQMRYFVGMTVPEIADALGLSPRTVDRHWAFARAWLKRTIRGSLSNGDGLH